MKRCKHKEWIHIVESCECKNIECKEMHEWLVHKCSKCGIEARALRIEPEKNLRVE